jgi:hypothetical protein
MHPREARSGPRNRMMMPMRALMPWAGMALKLRDLLDAE